MKKYLGLMLAAALLIALPAVSWGQAIQLSATRLDAATVEFTSATSAATITISPPASLYLYVTRIRIQNCAGAAAVVAAAVTTITTTGIGGGTTPAWTLGSGTTAGACAQDIGEVYATAYKSNTPGANVTVVLPAFAANQTVRVSVTGYYGL